MAQHVLLYEMDATAGAVACKAAKAKTAFYTGN